VLAAWEHAVATGETWSRDYRILGSDGEYHTIASRGVPIRDATGQVILWAGINLDITGRERLQGLVKEFRTLFAISRLIGEGDAGVEEVFRRTADLLPAGFRTPVGYRYGSCPGPRRPAAGGSPPRLPPGGGWSDTSSWRLTTPSGSRSAILSPRPPRCSEPPSGQAEANAATTASERQYPPPLRPDARRRAAARGHPWGFRGTCRVPGHPDQPQG